MNIKLDRKQLKLRCLEKYDFSVDNPYTFIDNGANVLAVAHTDFIGKSQRCFYDSNIVLSPQLDDRLGIYIICDLLPQLGINVDILLTDCEEMVQSTSMLFETTKQYHWMFSFDRAGNDVVLYQYNSKSLAKSLHKLNYKVSMGSYSDICDLEFLGIKGFNFGCGYHAQHTPGCYAYTYDIIKSVLMFIKFYNKYKNIIMPHTMQTTKQIKYNPYEYGNYYEEGNRIVCIYCGAKLHEHELYDGICDDCLEWEYNNKYSNRTQNRSAEWNEL